MLRLAMLLVAVPATLAAQSGFSLTRASFATYGFARDGSDAEHPLLVPEHPASLEFAYLRSRGGWRIAAGIHKSGADIAVRGPEAVIIARHALAEWGGSIDIDWRLAGDRGSATLRAGAGLLLEHWNKSRALSHGRWTPAGRARVSLEFPVTERIAGVVRAETIGSPSIFDLDELPEGYERRVGWRTGLAIGVVTRP